MMDSLAAQVGALLKTYGWSLVTAESCTGGGVAQAITEVAGSSVWFERGFITYSNLAKQQMLDVRENTLTKNGAVSEATVREMVEGALSRSASQIALAVSGIAGPDGGTTEKPVGTVWFAWGIKHGETLASMHLLTGNRSEIRAKAVHIALQGVRELLTRVTKTA